MREKITIGQRLQELRKNNDLSQKAVAVILNISQSKLSKIEHDHQLIDQITLEGFSDCYGVTTDYILGRSIFKYPITAATIYNYLHVSAPCD